MRSLGRDARSTGTGSIRSFPRRHAFQVASEPIRQFFHATFQISLRNAIHGFDPSQHPFALVRIGGSATTILAGGAGVGRWSMPIRLELR